MLLQGVPLICLQLRTKSWKLKNHICQKVSPVLKSLNKKLLDGTLKLGKIKFKVFLNWISKKKCQIWKMVLHPATSAENASCTPTPWQKKFITFYQISTLWRKGYISIKRNEAVIARGLGCRRHYQLRWQGAKKKFFFARG